MPKKLKVWNGRLVYFKKWKHGYVCAHSQKHAVELLQQTGYKCMSMSEIRNYWSDCWGNSMDGITPEVGVWVVTDSPNEKPTRLI